MAAFQICLQVWMASSLLADGLAVAGQAILANAFARGDYEKVVLTTSRVLQLGLVLDGLNYGVSDFAYSAYTMVLIAVLSVVCLFLLSSSYVFVGLWFALSIFMSLRALAGFLRIRTKSGPWSFYSD